MEGCKGISLGSSDENSGIAIALIFKGIALQQA
jgi:hypothetical protein